MPKLKFPLLLLCLGLSFAAMPVRTASAACRCTFVCWDTATQHCWMDECCNLRCCNISSPSCSDPCFG